MKLTKKILLGCALWLNIGIIAQADPINISKPELQPLVQFLTHESITKQSWPNLHYISMADLPAPYDSLLTQPLFTLGVTKYYQRTPKLRRIYVIHNQQQKTYSRAVLMIIDKNKTRDNAVVADQRGETVAVELGLITINLAALPSKVVKSILDTPQTPLVRLLVDDKVSVRSKVTSYFKINCNKALDPYVNCTQHPILYGRTNTLTRADNGQHISYAIQIVMAKKNRTR